MLNILHRLLEKRGVKEEELSPAEQATFNNYKQVLTSEVTLEKVKEFCHREIKLIEDKFAGPPSDQDIYLKACLHVYLNLLKAIEAPEAERETLEKYLEGLINNPNVGNFRKN